MAEEYNPMQDPTAAVERAKRKTVKKVRGQAGRAVTEDPNAPPAKKPTRVQGPTVLQRDTDVQKAAGIPVRRELPMQQQVRPKADVRIQKVTPAPPAKKDLTEKQIGGLKQKTIGQRQRADVDVRTGQPKTWWQRAKAYATRKEIPGARPPRTMEERALSIGRTAERGIGGYSPAERRRPGGQIDIRAMAARGRGPSLEAQKGTPAAAARRRALTLEEKKRKGMRVTAADVPGTGLPAGRGVGIPEITRIEGGEGLGRFRGRGYKPPPPKPKPKARVKAKPKPKPKKKWWERALEVTKELSAEAQRDAAQYEARQAGKKKQVKKVQRELEKLPPKPKRK